MLKDLKLYAKSHNIPIITDEGLAFLKEVIESYHVKQVLEIGTAIGYSALAISTFGCKVDTIERDLVMIELAKKNFSLYDHDQRVRLIEANALTYDGKLDSYDLIFIDGAKAQYQKFFEKYEKHLKLEGVIVCDNLNFHHLDASQVNRNTRQLLNKLKSFKLYLTNHPHFETIFYDLGDGVCLSKRKTK